MTTADFHETRTCLIILIQISSWKLEERFIYQHSVRNNNYSLTDGRTEVFGVSVRLHLTRKEPKSHQLTNLNIREWLLFSAAPDLAVAILSHSFPSSVPRLLSSVKSHTRWSSLSSSSACGRHNTDAQLHGLLHPHLSAYHTQNRAKVVP